MVALPNKSLFRLEEVALLFGVTVRTIRNWVAAGKLSTVTPTPRTIRIPRADVEKIMGK